MEANGARPTPEWMSVDKTAMTVTVNNLPTREQIEAPVEEQLIVEFYSK